MKPVLLEFSLLPGLTATRDTHGNRRDAAPCTHISIRESHSSLLECSGLIKDIQTMGRDCPRVPKPCPSCARALKDLQQPKNAQITLLAVWGLCLKLKSLGTPPGPAQECSDPCRICWGSAEGHPAEGWGALLALGTASPPTAEI